MTSNSSRTANVFIIITSKNNEFISEIINDASLIESYDYFFYGNLKAKFDIYQIETDTKIKITDINPPTVTNYISTKFLEKFASVEDARSELVALAPSNNPNIQLTKASSI